jgi:signal peptidase II
VPASNPRGKLRDGRILALILAALVIALDRWSKLWIIHHIRIGHARVIIPHVFRLTHVLNTGAAFSIFEGSSSPATVRNLLIAFSVIAVIVVLALLWKYAQQFTLVSFSLALILGGAIGNLYDRVRFSHVVDFLEVHIIHYHWPDFNVADSCICIGACLLLIEMLRPQHDAKR